MKKNDTTQTTGFIQLRLLIGFFWTLEVWRYSFGILKYFIILVYLIRILESLLKSMKNCRYSINIFKSSLKSRGIIKLTNFRGFYKSLDFVEFQIQYFCRLNDKTWGLLTGNSKFLPNLCSKLIDNNGIPTENLEWRLSLFIILFSFSLYGITDMYNYCENLVTIILIPYDSICVVTLNIICCLNRV